MSAQPLFCAEDLQEWEHSGETRRGQANDA